jgi:hypothetical protein
MTKGNWGTFSPRGKGEGRGLTKRLLTDMSTIKFEEI